MSNVHPRSASLSAPLLALVVGLVSGCIISEHGHGDWCKDEHHACADEYDCHSNQYCMRGSCEDIPVDAKACISSRDCGSGSTCVNGVCSRSCSRDLECTPGNYCDGYYCRAKPGTPTDGGTKPPPDGGTTCPPPPSDAGTPPPPPPPPTDAGTPGSCVRNTDCASGSYCINGACVRGCTYDTDCASAEMCSSGLCRARPAPTCTSATQCSDGNDCVDGACRTPCTSSTTCPSGSVCQIGYCMPSSTPASGKACAVNCDCPSGERCVERVCSL